MRLKHEKRPDLTKLPIRQQWLTLPNILTLIRLLAIPVMVYFILSFRLYPDNRIIALIIFLAIWLTDMLDGIIARQFGVITSVGKVLDPLTDKIFQFATAVSLWIVGYLPLGIIIALVLNHLLMVVGGIFLWRSGTVVHSNWYGKVTTALLIICFAMLFLAPYHCMHYIHLTFILPIVMAYISTIQYGLNYFYRGDQSVKP